jgi:hypothetical protein
VTARRFLTLAAGTMAGLYLLAGLVFAPHGLRVAAWLWAHPGTAAVAAIAATVVVGAAIDGITRGTRR